MNHFFRKLPLAVKLILIGLIPLVFLIYLTTQVYQQKSERLRILNRYIDRIHESATLSALIDALQEERKVSFDYALDKAKFSDVYRVRPLTDSLLLKVEKSNDLAFQGLKDYTYIDRLMETRKRIDTGKGKPNDIMHNYSNTIFRLNTLNTVPNAILLEPVYKDMAAQKLLTEMSTYLGIIRSNIYNVLVTRQYMVETMIGTVGTYDVYKSYEKEFLVKSSPEAIKMYQQAKNSTDLKITNQYIDSVFKRFRFDSSLSADQWWHVSNNAINQFTHLQQTIWKRIEVSVQSIYKDEKFSRNSTLVFFIIILNTLAFLVTYTVIVITTMLRDLRIAAEKISKGSTEVKVKHESNDVIGSLADCIAEIAKSNDELAEAAKAIGNGNFQVKISPRSEEDVLANSIVQMKESLFLYSEKMETLVKQRTNALETSNKDLQQFAHVISHDLKEPLRKIRTFTERLMLDTNNSLTEDSKNYLAKIAQSSSRMTKMIDGILTYSYMSSASEPFELTDLTAIAKNVKSDLELLIEQKKATITIHNLPQIEGAPVLLNQLLYNLMNNSLKFSKQNISPVIDIDCRKLDKEECLDIERNNCYEIIIRDNGIGFESEFAEKIFNTFSRLHSQSQYEGTGLGLALCKRIVDYHHGKIWAESNGDGAVFKILLPLKQEVRSVVNN